ncbi:MAG: DUF4242 domain-containing protein [Chitinophagaceae bacterium]|nr:DUF4242 domain-containing protein [Chitinophagaceae bacterium]
MKAIAVTVVLMAMSMVSLSVKAQAGDDIIDSGKPSLYIDVHHMGAGKVHAADVAGAHQKDLAVQGKYGVNFMKYWVDEKAGNIYCLASAFDSTAIRRAHNEAHGLLPDHIHIVSPGEEAAAKGGKRLFLDIHQFGPGKVSAADVAGAHQKDLAVQKKYGVNFINYWVDESTGVVMCLSEAKDSKSIQATHKEAHGLMPSSIQQVQEGK